MTKKKLNVAVIGCGKIAQMRHLPEYAANPNVTLVGYFDYTAQRAARAAQEYGGQVYASIKELLADSKIDAVSVCLANAAHAQVSIQALEAGKDVLCEKPMATTIEDCKAMIHAARDYHRALMIGHNQRLAQAHLTAKKLLSQGLIGRVLSFKTTFGHGGPEQWSVNAGPGTWFFDQNRSKFGAIFDLGVHKTDLIQYLLDSRVVSVSAKMATLDKKDADGNFIAVDDNAISIYTMANGAIGTMSASWTYYGEEDNSTILYGSKGIMKIYDDPHYAIKIILKNGEKIFYDTDQIQTNDHQANSGVIDEFVSAILEKRPSMIDAITVLAAMRAVFAAVESNKLGKTVQVTK
ncbi:MAG: Gfo/Idh/MocA family oxidoreductase [Oenococcus sp.]|uniref:Gfo/Idh/MocA family protein n=1 Tax=Oenococcus TaxID=46254 RepID=UPI0021E93A0B|nr:Gfo/Idh/MocA family oxidoreductase [Oenococcus kitaharae]MCV3296611.1 Gfo/Idh/MocA family oxidoreductase [Oenococcus kitaharae]